MAAAWAAALRSRRSVQALLVAGCVVTAGSCAPLPRQAFASARLSDYLASRPELTPEIARAIDTGHLVLGMDTRQVWVVLGDPIRRTSFQASRIEVWLYGPGRLHQDQLHTHGNEAFRVVFREGRLILIETL